MKKLFSIVFLFIVIYAKAQNPQRIYASQFTFKPKPAFRTATGGRDVLMLDTVTGRVYRTQAASSGVTSVGLGLPVSVFSVSGSPVTGAGTLTGSFINQSANTIFAGPSSGGAAEPSFRTLVAADIPTGSNNYIQNQIAAAQTGNAWVSGILRGTSLRMAALIMSESGSTTTFNLQGFNLTTDYGSNGTATHVFTNGALNVTRSSSSKGGSLSSYGQTSPNMGNIIIGNQLANDQYPTVGASVNGYHVGTLGYNTLGTANLQNGIYGVSWIFNNQSVANNSNAAWLHANDGVNNIFPIIVKKTGDIDYTGKHLFSATNTSAGTTGNQTINKPSGTVNVAAAGTTITVTNNLVTANSIVYAVIRTNDSTAWIRNVVPGEGTFTITLGASATAETSIGFVVFN